MDLTYIKGGTTFILLIFGYFLGGFDIMLKALILFIVMDYITGCFYAYKNKTLSSETGSSGLMKKACILFAVGMAEQLDMVLEVDYLRFAVIGFYLANEALSIIENIGNLGLPIPPKLRRALQQINDEEILKEKEDKNNE